MMGIQQFCKEHKMWGAKDSSGAFYAYAQRPRVGSEVWVSLDGMGRFIRVDEDSTDLTLRPWNEFLIRPDGEIELLKPSNATATTFEEGKYYKCVLKCKEDAHGMSWNSNGEMDFLLNGKPHKVEHSSARDGGAYSVVFEGQERPWIVNAVDFVEVPAPKKWEPKKYETVFVYDDDSDLRIPAKIRSFCRELRRKDYPYQVFHEELFGADGEIFAHIRKFDPALTSTPIKDWPPSEDQY